jgi:hypothetical protein
MSNYDDGEWRESERGNWWRNYHGWLVIVYRARGSGKWGGLFRPREDEDAKPRFMIGAYSNPLAAQRTVMRELQEHLADEARIRRQRVVNTETLTATTP